MRENRLAIRDRAFAPAREQAVGRANEEARETTKQPPRHRGAIGRGTIYMLIYMRLITMSDGAYRHALRAVPAAD